MQESINFLEIVFRVCLFSLLAYKLAELAKIHLIPLLSHQLFLERKEQSELLDKEKLLISTRKKIEHNIYLQKQMLTLLEKNVQVWHKSLADNHTQAEIENDALIQKTVQKRMWQQQNMLLAMQLSQSMPIALAQAEQILSEQSKTEAGNTFLKSIINQLPTSNTVIKKGA